MSSNSVVVPLEVLIYIVPLAPPLKGPVAPVALELPGVSHVKLPLKGCRSTRGGAAATLASVALHCAHKKITELIPK